MATETKRTATMSIEDNEVKFTISGGYMNEDSKWDIDIHFKNFSVIDKHYSIEEYFFDVEEIEERLRSEYIDFFMKYVDVTCEFEDVEVEVEDED